MQPITLDQAVDKLDRLGLHVGYTVALPDSNEGVYTGSVYPDDLSQQRLVHLDQYTGTPLLDLSYTDYGVIAKWIEWGVNNHIGQTFGLINKIVLLAACVAIVVLALSAAIMWWKRRPSGSLGVPPMPARKAALRGLLAILGIGGLIFPLVGASLMVMIALDTLYVRLISSRISTAV